MKQSDLITHMKTIRNHAPSKLAHTLLCFCFTGFLTILNGQTKNDAPDEVVKLSPFEVKSTQDYGYASTNAVSGTRFNTPLVKIPQSIIVLNQNFMKDIGAISVVDAAQYVSGIAVTAGANRDVFLVNGYQVTVTTDGFPDDTSQAQGLTTPLELVDRVEIIKGPSAVLYGSTNPGGNVNRVTKKPVLSKNMTALETTIGDEGLTRGIFDVNQSASTNSGPIAIRVIGSYEHYDKFVNFGDSNSYFIAPMIAWKPTPKTTIIVQPSYLYRNYHKKFATLFQFRPFDKTGLISLNLPRDVDWGGKNYREKFIIRRLFVQLNQEITDKWNVRLVAMGRRNAETSDNETVPRDLLLDNRRMQRTWRTIRNWDTYQLCDIDSLIKYDIGNTKNQTLITGQYYRPKTDMYYITGRKLSGQDIAGGENSDATFSNLPLIDVYNPDPVALNASPDSTYISSNTTAGGEIASSTVLHMIELFDGKLAANIGGRFDRSRSYGNNNLTKKTTSHGINKHYTKRAGVAYMPWHGIALFYNYSETFTPQFSVNPDGTGFKPTEGRISEEGVKADMLDGKITGTASVFNVVNKNIIVLSSDPLLASAGYRSQEAQDSFDGVQLDLHFDFIKNLQVLTSYSHLKSKTVTGLLVRDVPLETAAAFISYAFGDNHLGWSAGVGWRYKGSRPATTDNVLFEPADSVYDAFLSYVYSKRLSFHLNCNNLFDKYYADSSINRNCIFAGPERRLRLTVDYNY